MRTMLFRRLRAGAVLAALVVVLIGGVTAAQERWVWTAEAMLDVTEISGLQISPDGKSIVYTLSRPVNGRYSTSVHMAAIDGRGARQLTQDGASRAAQWSPDGKSIAYLTNVKNRTNVVVMSAQGGEGRPVTDTGGVLGFQWSPNSAQIAYTTTDAAQLTTGQGLLFERFEDRSQPSVRIWVVSVARDRDAVPAARVLTLGPGSARGGSQAFAWSPDGESIAFTTRPKEGDEWWPLQDILLLNVRTGETRNLAATPRAEHDPVFSPDGKFVVYQIAEDPPRWRGDRTVRVSPLDGGPPLDLAVPPNSEPSILGWSATGTEVYVAESKGTGSAIYALSLDGGIRTVHHAPDQFFSNISGTRGMVAFMSERADAPPEGYVSSLEKWQPIQITSVNAPATRAVARTETIRWKAADGLEIEGLLTYPARYETGRRYPLLVIAHGGPNERFTHSYIGRFHHAPYPVAAFAERGYVVLRPNVRGSSGYGAEFRYANHADLGGKDFDDILAGVDDVVRRGVADPERLGIMGWSYGGYMSATAVTRSRRFKAASIGASIEDWISAAGTSDIPSGSAPFFGGEFWQLPELYRKRSPVHNVKGATTPTLIQHGRYDTRVPLGQALEMYTGLKRQGTVVELQIYPHGHGPFEPRTLPTLTNENLKWFERYVPARVTALTPVSTP